MAFYKTHPPVFTVTATLNTFFEAERHHAKREHLFNVTTITFIIIIVKYEHLRFEFC